MRSEGKNTLIKKTYKTADIIKCVEDTFYKYWQTCYTEAQTLKGATEYDTCKNVWQYVIDHTSYIEDAPGTQFVKSPARLLDDGTGDCKSMSVMCASLLTCCGIRCSFRFVSFRENSSLSHVYVVTASGINVDPVEYFQKGREFNEVTPYKTKMDKPIEQGLAILSGIDIGATTEPYEVWLGGTNIIDNTYATNYLYTAIDLQFSLINIDENDTNALNECDRLLCALLLYNRATSNDDQLRRAGHILQYMTDCGEFNYDSTEDSDRTAHLNSVTDNALNLFVSEREFYEQGGVYDWWMENVFDYDYKNDANKLAGIGLVLGNREQMNLYVNEIKRSGCYHVYGELENNTASNYNKSMPQLRKKRAIQQAVKKSWAAGFSEFNLNAQTIDNAIRSGLATTTRAATPDLWLNETAKKLRSGEEKIGDFGISAIIALITAITTILATVASLVTAIQQNKLAEKALDLEYGNNKQAQGILDEANKYADGAAKETDFNGLATATGGSSTSSSTGGGNMGIMAAALAAVFILKNNKGKK